MTAAIPTSVHLDRCAGALLGLAVGDALGAGYEFTNPSPDTDIDMIGGGLGGFAPGEWTDDTSQAVAIARVTARGAVDLHATGAGFLEWFAGGPGDIGISTSAVLSQAGGDPARLMGAADRYFELNPKTAAGNGALMRTAPVALLHLGDDEAIARDAMAVASLTHGDPLAGEGCVLWCIAIDRAIRQDRFDGVWDGLALLPEASRPRWEQVLRDAEDHSVPLPARNGAVFTALQAAYGAIHRTPVPAEEPGRHLAAVLEAAVRIGGDTDTVAAIAGQLVGARWGASAVPPAWREAVHGWPGMRASDLVRLAEETVSHAVDVPAIEVQAAVMDDFDDADEAWAMLEAQGQMEGSAYHGDNVFGAATRRLAPRADDPLLQMLGGSAARVFGVSDPSVIDPVVVAAAASFAIQKHGDQLRKGTTKPYWTHLAAVAGLVAEHGGTTHQVAAAWLHDVIEDCGGHRLLDELRAVFGAEVAEMVEALSDSTVEDRADKLPWRARKEAYLDRIRGHVGAPSMLVSLADKLHNAESIVADLDDPEVGLLVFQRFSVPSWQTSWQYRQLHEAFAEDPSLPPTMLARLGDAVERIYSMVAGVR